MLVEDIERSCVHYISTRRGEDYLEQRAKIYHSLMLRGKLQLTVLWLKEMEKGGVFHPEDTCSNTGQPIL